jgi:hypothetical protein
MHGNKPDRRVRAELLGGQKPIGVSDSAIKRGPR